MLACALTHLSRKEADRGGGVRVSDAASERGSQSTGRGDKSIVAYNQHARAELDKNTR